MGCSVSLATALTLNKWMRCTLAVRLTLALAQRSRSILREPTGGGGLLIVKDHIVVAFN